MFPLSGSRVVTRHWKLEIFSTTAWYFPYLLNVCRVSDDPRMSYELKCEERSAHYERRHHPDGSFCAQN